MAGTLSATGGAETESVSTLATPVPGVAAVAISPPAGRGATTPVPSPSVSVTGCASGTSARTETVAAVLGALSLPPAEARGSGVDELLHVFGSISKGESFLVRHGPDRFLYVIIQVAVAVDRGVVLSHCMLCRRDLRSSYFYGFSSLEECK